MNICFLIGKIISNIDFKFVMNDKNNISISIFKLKVNDGSTITLKAYNELADLCYRNLSINNYIVLQGRLNSNMEIILYDIEIL